MGVASRLIMISVIAAAACNKIELPEGVPSCVEDKIRRLQRESCPSVGAVYQYEFQGETVYVFNPKLCGSDLLSEVTNEACETVCILGGVAGVSVCNGDSFYTIAKNERLIWRE